MTMNRFRWLPGAIALVLSSAVALPTFAQPAQEPTPSTQQRPNRMKNRLNLTDVQKTQLRQIRESTRTQIEGVLTQEQKAQYDTAKQQRQKPREIWRSLNLTAEQRSQIQAIQQSAKQQMEGVLTPDQLQQMQQRRQSRPQARPNAG